MRSQRVVISSYTFLPEIGGVATTVAYLASGFAELGFDTTVVTSTAEESREVFPFRVVRCPSFGELLGLYRSSDFLLLSNLSLKLGIPALLAGRPYALSHHSESAFDLEEGWRPGSFVKRKLRNRAVVHFVTSDYVGRRSGLSNLCTVHPFANPKYVTPEIRKPISQRSNALFVGRLVEEKGVLEIIRRWSHLREVLGVDELRLVGSGALESELNKGISQGHYPHVRMVGRLSLAETAKEMGHARYLWVPSLWAEPFGAVALEGLAAGAVVISSRRGGLPEAYGDLGFSYDPESDVELLQAALSARELFNDMLMDDGKSQAYLAAVDAWCAHFTPKKAAEIMLNAVFSR